MPGYEHHQEEIELAIFPIDEFLYCVSHWSAHKDGEKNFRLYNHDLTQLLGSWVPPAGYNLNPYGSLQPKIHNGKIYQEVRNTHAYSNGGMMVLEIEEGENGYVKIAPRPPVTMIASPSLEESHKLVIYLDVDNLDDALRYGEIYTQELYYSIGYIAHYNLRKNALDRNHNGVIELVIDDSSFDETDANEYLDNLENDLYQNLSDGFVSGDKKILIKFKLIQQPKGDWNINGYQLDWPAICEQKTPLV